jgi:glucose-6-phosphate-specific signal transduction histidine kinase
MSLEILVFIFFMSLAVKYFLKKEMDKFCLCIIALAIIEGVGR